MARTNTEQRRYMDLLTAGVMVGFAELVGQYFCGATSTTEFVNLFNERFEGPADTYYQTGRRLHFDPWEIAESGKISCFASAFLMGLWSRATFLGNPDMYPSYIVQDLYPSDDPRIAKTPIQKSHEVHGVVKINGTLYQQWRNKDRVWFEQIMKPTAVNTIHQNSDQAITSCRFVASRLSRFPLQKSRAELALRVANQRSLERYRNDFSNLLHEVLLPIIYEAAEQKGPNHYASR